MNNGKDLLRPYSKTSLYRTIIYRALFLTLMGSSSLSFSQTDLVENYYGEELQEDEAGIWMVVEKQEQDIRTSSIHVKDPELQSFIEEILCEMIPDGCALLRPYIIRSPGFNAFMMPNGAFFIQSGLLLRIQNKDQLASVIGHEAAHFFRRHTMERLREVNSRSNTFAVLGAIVSAASAVSINSATSLDQLNNSVNMSNAAVRMLQTAQIIAVLQLLKYSREDETEADLDSVKWMSEAEFNPNEAVAVWEQLNSENDAGGKNAGFSLLSTHPTPAQRIRELTTTIGNLTNKDVRAEEEPSLIDIIAQYRQDWIVDEMRVLHPDQFLYLIDQQSIFGIPPHLIKYFSALSYIDASTREEFTNRELQDFSRMAIDLMQEASSFEQSNEMPEIFRELGRLRESAGEIEASRAAYERYLELSPDAWDARFIRRKL